MEQAMQAASSPTGASKAIPRGLLRSTRVGQISTILWRVPPGPTGHPDLYVSGEKEKYQVNKESRNKKKENKIFQ